MNKQFEQYIKVAKSVAMTAEESSKILGNLKMTMETSPITSNVSWMMLIRSPYFFQFSREKVMVFALMAVFLLTGGTSFAAQNALPGDTLYPIKVGLNEEVKGFFARSPVAKANLNAEIALTRLEEAEKLQAEGRLDMKSRSIIESNFETHADKVKTNLEVSDSSNNDYEKTLEVANNFESSLHAHKGVFMALSAGASVGSGNSEEARNDTTQNSDHLVGVVAKVASELTNATSSNAAATRLDATAEIATEAQISQKLNMVMTKISNTEKYVNEVKIDSETRKEALNAIETVKNLATQAKIKLTQHSYKEAFLLLTDVNNRLGKISSSIKVENEANIELNGRVNVQTGQTVDLNKNESVIIDQAKDGTSINSSIVSSSTISRDQSSVNLNSNASINSTLPNTQVKKNPKVELTR